MYRTRWIAVAAVATLLLTFTRAEDRVFVSLEGIPGGSTDPAHSGWIDAFGFSSGIEALENRTINDPLAFLKATDVATPLLHRAAAGGQSLPSAKVELCRQEGDSSICWFRIDLSDVYITTVSLAGSACVEPTACGATMTESVKLHATSVQWSYLPVSAPQVGAPARGAER